MRSFVLGNGSASRMKGSFHGGSRKGSALQHTTPNQEPPLNGAYLPRKVVSRNSWAIGAVFPSRGFPVTTAFPAIPSRTGAPRGFTRWTTRWFRAKGWEQSPTPRNPQAAFRITDNASRPGRAPQQAIRLPQRCQGRVRMLFESGFVSTVHSF